MFPRMDPPAGFKTETLSEARIFSGIGLVELHPKERIEKHPTIPQRYILRTDKDDFVLFMITEDHYRICGVWKDEDTWL